MITCPQLQAHLATLRAQDRVYAYTIQHLTFIKTTSKSSAEQALSIATIPYLNDLPSQRRLYIYTKAYYAYWTCHFVATFLIGHFHDVVIYFYCFLVILCDVIVISFVNQDLGSCTNNYLSVYT